MYSNFNAVFLYVQSSVVMVLESNAFYINVIEISILLFTKYRFNNEIR